MTKYKVMAVESKYGGYTYDVYKNGSYQTNWGAKAAIRRMIKAANKRPAKREKLEKKFPDFPIVYVAEV